MDRQQVNFALSYGQGRSPAHRYQQVDLASRIDGATPHTLVAMLYAELSVALAVMQRAAEAGDPARQRAQHERASSILHTLEASLDRANGGALADSLARIYRQMRHRLLAGRGGDAAAVAEVSSGVESLADAWGRIGT